MLTSVAATITSTASSEFTAPLVFAVAAVLAQGNLRARLVRAGLVLAVMLSAVLCRYGISELIARPRPSTADWAVQAGGLSFPSGHTSDGALAAGLIAWLVVHQFTGRVTPWVVWLIAVAYALLIAWTRVYLGCTGPPTSSAASRSPPPGCPAPSSCSGSTNTRCRRPRQNRRGERRRDHLRPCPGSGADPAHRPGRCVRWGELGQGRAVLIAAVRAVAQLAAVSLVITAVLRSTPLTGLFVLLMFGIAAATSARRAGPWTNLPGTAFAIAAGVAPVLALVLGAGVVPLKPIAVVPIAGIVIGGAMTATSQAARRPLTNSRPATANTKPRSRSASCRARPRSNCRPSAGHALIPALDQTRTVGLGDPPRRVRRCAARRRRPDRPARRRCSC